MKQFTQYRAFKMMKDSPQVSDLGLWECHSPVYFRSPQVSDLDLEVFLSSVSHSFVDHSLEDSVSRDSLGDSDMGLEDHGTDGSFYLLKMI